MNQRAKPRIAFFDFACCEGCQLSVLEMDDMLDLFKHVVVVAWREVMSEIGDDYDIAFCEGSITRPEDMDRIERIRRRARILVSLGACASIGCHNALKNRWPMDDSLKLVYGDQAHHFETIPARPITAVVSVDYQIQGCPASLREVATVFKHILTGQQYFPPNQPVCVECKLKDNLCVYEKGLFCLGPITRCGCDAICTTFGDACQGCRGLIDHANLDAVVKVFAADKHHRIMAEAVQKYGFTERQIMDKIALYNRREKESHGS